MLHQLSSRHATTIRPAIPDNAVLQLRIAKGNSDTENVQESRNVSVKQFNAYIAWIHMKHGLMRILHESLRNI